MDLGSFVVTGGGRGVGRAVVERLLAAGAWVVAVERAAESVSWLSDHPAADRAVAIVAYAGDEEVAATAAERAAQAAPLAGWVNNAAVFQDASLHTAPAATVLDLVGRNIAAAIAGCAAAVRAFRAAGTGGAIVNVSSHQAQRAVPGVLPYVTAKAAIEGLTRAVAAEYGPDGIRANAVALGSIAVERYRDDIARLGPVDGPRIDRETGALHALGRVGLPSEAAAAIAWLLSDEASFVSGAVLPVDGGRSILAREPERPEVPDHPCADGALVR